VERPKVHYLECNKSSNESSAEPGPGDPDYDVFKAFIIEEQLKKVRPKEIKEVSGFATWHCS